MIFDKIYGQRYKILLAIFLLIMIFPAMKVHEHFFKYYIVAQFNELGPISITTPVYYKGFKIGKVAKIKPSPDFKTSNVKLIFDHNMSMLPSNVSVKVKKFDVKKQGHNHYLDIEYPDAPALTILKKGSTIKGVTEPDMASFMAKQVESGAFNAISNNAGKAIESLEKTSDSARDMIEVITDLIDRMKPDLLAAAKSANSAAANVDETTKNTMQITAEMNELAIKLNKSVSKVGVEEAVSNIGKTLENLERATENMKSITVNVDKATTNLDQTFYKIDSSMGNVQNITEGMNNTLNKRFGGARVIFGKPGGNVTVIKEAAKSAPTGAATSAPPKAQTIAPAKAPTIAPGDCIKRY